MRGQASESAASPVSHNAADPVELNDVCHTKLKLPYQTDSEKKEKEKPNPWQRCDKLIMASSRVQNKTL